MHYSEVQFLLVAVLDPSLFHFLFVLDERYESLPSHLMLFLTSLPCVDGL